ncbi:MAG: hypothetical protein ACSHX6_00845 [Akkermansiaceae bacterium]
MKILRNLPTFALPLVGASSVLLTSCGALDKLNQPLSDTGYNPLDKPGMRSSSSSSAMGAGGSQSLVNSNDHGFNNGDIVEVVIPNTALFAKVPKAGDRYKKVLNVGDSLRVIGGEKDFIQVVTESGDTGYVSSVMVVTQGFLTNSGPIDPNVTAVGANETPIVPDVAPDPVVQGIGSPDAAPGIAPAPVPSITAPVPVDPDPGLIVPDVPDAPLVPAPIVPDPTPVVPSLPDAPAPEPSSPGISE